MACTFAYVCVDVCVVENVYCVLSEQSISVRAVDRGCYWWSSGQLARES
jgi:hypothetical protein